MNRQAARKRGVPSLLQGWKGRLVKRTKRMPNELENYGYVPSEDYLWIAPNPYNRAMSLDGIRQEEREALVRLLAELSRVEPEPRMRESIWHSFEAFEQKGIFGITFSDDLMVLKLRDDPKELTLPRGIEFVKVVNDRFQFRRKRLEQMLRKVYTPPRKEPPLAEVIPIRD